MNLLEFLTLVIQNKIDGTSSLELPGSKKWELAVPGLKTQNITKWLNVYTIIAGWENLVHILAIRQIRRNSRNRLRYRNIVLI